MKTIFLRALEEFDDKASVLRMAIQNPEMARGRQRFEVDVASFGAVPRSPFAYWVSDGLRGLFKQLPPFESEDRTARQGLATADDFRFVRGWWAVPPQFVGEHWFPFAKGGKLSPFYSDVHLVVNWERGGDQVKNHITQRYPYLNGNAAFVAKNTDFYFRPGLTWALRTKSELSLRAMPAGSIFSHKGPAAFNELDSSAHLLAMLSITSSKVFRSLVEFQLAAADARPGGAAHSYEVGVIQRTPIPHLNPADLSTFAALAHRHWSLRRSLDTRDETSHAFYLPALLQAGGSALAARADDLAKRFSSIETELTALQAEIDDLCFARYGIDGADQRAITEGFGSNFSESEDSLEVGGEGDAVTDDEGDVEISADAWRLAAELVSWTVGVAFGRFDIRVALGALALPAEPEPFAPLPVCSPAMLTVDDGLPVASAPAGYPVPFPETGILVDDRGHARDLSTAMRTVFEAVFKTSADAWWNEVGGLLDPKDHDLRTWLASSYFEQHLKRHSKSRRKAPIVWQLAIPSVRYSVWLYAHRLTRDSLFQIQNDVVNPKLAHEERQLTNLIRGAGASPSAKEREEIAAQEAFVEELRELLDEVKRVAPLWNPSLDDGVVLTMAPLWRLVPQHKSWQKELKSKWGELVGGKYDWAHLAMHLWPERVVPKCATDRSLAIAHGLEDIFWVEGDYGNWKSRPAPTRQVEELVRERTSMAVKSALKSLLEAPVANANGGRGRRRRAVNAAANGGAR
jgi:hypothetical protein